MGAPGLDFETWDSANCPRTPSHTAGLGFAGFVVIAIFAGSILTRRTFTSATISIVPAVFVACTITCARPLKSERRGSLSLSWQLGSPLPTPISAPSPVTLNRPACRPWARRGPGCRLLDT